MDRMTAAVEMDVLAGPEAEGARRATGASGPAGTSRAPDPDPEVPATVQRRRFPAEYRLRIVKQADACKQPGELGALLRREGLYSSHLVTWRRERQAGILKGLTPHKRGPKCKRNPQEEEMQKLRRENQRLTEQLRKAEIVIDVQKKVGALLGWPLPKADPEEKP